MLVKSLNSCALAVHRDELLLLHYVWICKLHAETGLVCLFGEPARTVLYHHCLHIIYVSGVCTASCRVHFADMTKKMHMHSIHDIVCSRSV
jgi:hypothetical protein